MRWKDRTLYRIAIWASWRRIDWLAALIYRYRCPCPIDGITKPMACYLARLCSCDNAARSRRYFRG